MVCGRCIDTELIMMLVLSQNLAVQFRRRCGHVRNQLTGRLPTDIGNLVDLRQLGIYGLEQTHGPDTSAGHTADQASAHLLTGWLSERLGKLVDLSDVYQADWTCPSWDTNCCSRTSCLVVPKQGQRCGRR